MVLAVVLIVPFLFALIFPVFTETTAGGRTGVWLIAAVTAMEVPLGALIIWAVRRRGDPLSSVGVVRPGIVWLVATIALVVVAGWLIWARQAGVWAGAVPTGGARGGTYTAWQRIALVALGVPQIYLQELIFRGFAITVLHRATGSFASALVVSSAAF